MDVHLMLNPPVYGSRWSAWARGAACALLATFSLACTESPETQLVGTWRESHWTYAKFDGYDSRKSASLDATFWSPHLARNVVRHEAELWEFLPGGRLRISKKNGGHVSALWRLKGRGHVLALEVPATGVVEYYEIKQLSDGQLVLHHDLGMELRGIAQFSFERFAATASQDAARAQRAVAFAGSQAP